MPDFTPFEFPSHPAVCGGGIPVACDFPFPPWNPVQPSPPLPLVHWFPTAPPTAPRLSDEDIARIVEGVAQRVAEILREER